jgi:hypothetical protein
MMKRILSFSSLAVLCCLFSTSLLAQTINHPFNNGVTTNIVVGAGGYTYYDSGGPAGNYLNNHNNAATLLLSSLKRQVRKFRLHLPNLLLKLALMPCMCGMG